MTGRTLTLTLLAFATLTAPASAGFNQWSYAGQMPTDRTQPALAALGNGRALVAGGQTYYGTLAGAAIYDAKVNEWSPAPSMHAARSAPSATLLPSGGVLVAGGTTAEVFLDGTWTTAGTLNAPRARHAAVALADGRVLVVGGDGTTATEKGAEVWTGAGWTLTGKVSTVRVRPAIARLRDGSVLVAGGTSWGSDLATAELYDPIHNVWTPVASMAEARGSVGAALLPDGRVLVAGGGTRTTEIYDPATRSWSRGADLTVARPSSVMVTLADGRPAIVGDLTAEIFDPSRGTWALTAELQLRRSGHAAAALSDNTLLVAGGASTYGHAERFLPAPIVPPADTPIQPSPGTVNPHPGPQAGPPTGARGTLAFVRPLPKRVSRGQLTVKLRCAGGACGDTVVLKRGSKRLASKDFSVRSGGTVIVRLKLRAKLPKRATAVKFSLARQKLAVSSTLKR